MTPRWKRTKTSERGVVYGDNDTELIEGKVLISIVHWHKADRSKTNLPSCYNHSPAPANCQLVSYWLVPSYPGLWLAVMIPVAEMLQSQDKRWQIANKLPNVETVKLTQGNGPRLDICWEFIFSRGGKRCANSGLKSLLINIQWFIVKLVLQNYKNSRA